MEKSASASKALSLAELAEHVCPVIRRLHLRATMIAARTQPLPVRVASRLPACANQFANETISRFLNSDDFARKQFPDDMSSLADLRRTRLAEFEKIVHEEACREAEHQARILYRRLSFRMERQICEQLLRALADGSRYRFIGRRGDVMNDPIPDRFASRCKIAMGAQTVTLPPISRDDQEQVWRDVGVELLIDDGQKKRGGAHSIDDTQILLKVRHELAQPQPLTMRGAILKHASARTEAEQEAVIKRVTRKINRGLLA